MIAATISQGSVYDEKISKKEKRRETIQLLPKSF